MKSLTVQDALGLDFMVTDTPFEAIFGDKDEVTCVDIMMCPYITIEQIFHIFLKSQMLSVESKLSWLKRVTQYYLDKESIPYLDSTVSKFLNNWQESTGACIIPSNLIKEGYNNLDALEDKVTVPITAVEQISKLKKNVSHELYIIHIMLHLFVPYEDRKAEYKNAVNLLFEVI